MSTTSAHNLWGAMWRPLAATCAAAAAVIAAAIFLAIPRFDDLIEVYLWLLLIVVLATCSLRLARDGWRLARRQEVGRLATAITAAATVASSVVSVTLIIAVVVEVLSSDGGG